MDIKDLKKRFLTKKGAIDSNAMGELNELLSSHFGDLPTKEKFYLICEQKKTVPVCRCGSPVKFISFQKGYKEFCNACSRKEGFLKGKRTNLERYGSENPFQVEEFKEKTKVTNKLRYGEENAAKVKFFKEKATKTNEERYGGHPSRNKDVVKKKMETCIKRYGGVSPAASEEVRNKMQKTNFDRYGVAQPLQSKIFRDKLKKTTLERYGADNYTKTEEYRTSIMRETYRRKKEVLMDTHVFRFNEDDYLNRESESQKFEFRCKKCDGIYFDHLNNGNIPLCSHCYPRNPRCSTSEKELSEFVKKLGVPIIENDRLILSGKEIDILSVEKNIAIEFNGIYWHSTSIVDKNHHLDKTDICLSKGIRLVHVFEDDWKTKRSLVESRISSIFGVHQDTIYARKVSISEVSGRDSRIFLETNHLQGYSSAKVNYGLYRQNELISLMSFGRPRFNDDYEWELIRYANKQGINVVGGPSKLLTHFIRNHSPESILTYQDRLWGDSEFYSLLGFELERRTEPGYFYVNSYPFERKHRLQMSKKNQEKTMKKFDENLNEEENAYLNGWYKIWDCGQNVYGWKK